MKRYGKKAVKRLAFRLEEGDEVRLKYTAFREPTRRALKEAMMARQAGLNLHEYCGEVEKVWVSARDGSLCLCILALQRVNRKTGYCYRTFNLDKGKVHWLEVL